MEWTLLRIGADSGSLYPGVQGHDFARFSGLEIEVAGGLKSGEDAVSGLRTGTEGAGLLEQYDVKGVEGAGL